MIGKEIIVSVYIANENIEKLEKIQKHLNNLPEVLEGEAPQWKEKDVLELLLNDAIEKYKI